MLDDELERQANAKALADIEKYGCHVIHVIGEDELPPFSYSVGIKRSSASSEIALIGLKQPIAHFAVNEYNRRVRSGERFSHGQLASGFLEGFDVLFLKVDRVHYREYFGWNRWLYKGDDFDVLQLVWPSTKGAWPWESEAFDGFDRWQPILSTLPDSMRF
jgi:hypothetical protein